MNDPDPALLSKRDREPRLRHGVHGGRDDRDVQREIPTEAGLQIYVARQYFGVGGLQEDVVESKRLMNDSHRCLRRLETAQFNLRGAQRKWPDRTMLVPYTR